MICFNRNCSNPAFQEALHIESISNNTLLVKDIRAYITVLPRYRGQMCKEDE